MLKTISKHSLVIAFGPSSRNRQETVTKYFDDYEIISASKLCNELVGEINRPDLDDIIFSEMKRRALLKLSLGERVIIDSPFMRKEDRLIFANLGIQNGVPVFYLLTDPMNASETQIGNWQLSEKDLMRGDGLAEVIDWRNHIPSPVAKSNLTSLEISKKWNGITVVSDVHGMYHSLLSVLSWARSRNHYLIFLGDIIDYGPGTLDVSDEIYNIVMRGEGELILGNHERKIWRWLEYNDNKFMTRMSDGNKVTINALNKLGDAGRAKWQGRFIGLVSHANYVRQLENITLAHAGIHSSYWTSYPNNKDIQTWALFGEYEKNMDYKSNRKYDWVDYVPNHHTVLVGHDIRSKNRPLNVINKMGGTTVFMDTGSGKGGVLSSADLKYHNDKWKVESFNIW